MIQSVAADQEVDGRAGSTAAMIARAPRAGSPAWPLLLAGTVAAVAGGGAGAWRTLAGAGAVGLGWLLAQSFFLFQGVGPDLPWVMAVPLGSAAPLLAPLIPAAALRKAALAAAMLAAAAVALYVRFDPLAPTVPPYSLQHGH